MEIFGIPIDTLTREAILAQVKKFLAEPHFHRIATVNPEFLLLAEKNKVFRTTLLDADLRIADGFGIVLAGWLRGKRIERFAGADLMAEVLQIANDNKQSVYLAVSRDGLSTYETIKSALLRKHPDVTIDGADTNLNIHSPSPQISSAIVFCNFGAPLQEIYLNSLKGQHNIRLAMGVGGSFDYLTGKQKRAPRWLRVIGLEWLWRLIQQPQRIQRIWNAVIVFPFRIIFATIDK